jgi:hypothetical protein
VVRMNANSVPDALATAVVEMPELKSESVLNQGSAMWESRARCGISKGETLLSEPRGETTALTTCVLSNGELNSARSKPYIIGRAPTLGRVRLRAPSLAKSKGFGAGP